MHYCSYLGRPLVSYHDGRVVRTWYGNGKIEIEAVFTLLGVRIPHIGTRKALKHHVNDLNTGIRAMVCFLNARPPFDTVYILGQYALKGGFYSESAICFSNLQITILSHTASFWNITI